jgi:CelD/BcsL family acetyltransferase involved in cellulose biosynthesis
LVRGDVHARLAPEDADRLLRQALAAVEPVDIAELPRQPMRIGRAENPFGERESVLSPLRTHALTIGADGPRVVEQAYAKRTRQRFAAFERKMQGRLAFHRVGPGPEAAAAMDQLIAWKRAQTAQRGEPSVMNDPAFRTFLTDFAARSQAPLEMAQLLIDGVPASAAVIQHRPSRQVVYQFAYDQENPFTHESPGRMLMRRMILDAAAAGAEELDFTIGDEPYKLSLCDRTERLRDQWIGLTPLGAAAAAFARARAEARIRLGPETRLGKALRRTLLRRAHAPGASFAA